MNLKKIENKSKNYLEKDYWKRKCRPILNLQFILMFLKMFRLISVKNWK